MAVLHALPPLSLSPTFHSHPGNDGRDSCSIELSSLRHSPDRKHCNTALPRKDRRRRADPSLLTSAGPSSMDAPPPYSELDPLLQPRVTINDLPPELLRPIFAHLSPTSGLNKYDMLSCALVCRTWNEPASFHLYHNISLLSETQGRLLLLGKLETRRTRKLVVRCAFPSGEFLDQRNLVMPSTAESLLRQARGLQTLVLLGKGTLGADVLASEGLGGA